MPFTDPEALFTERGISRPDLDRLYAAHKVLAEFDKEICDAMCEGPLRSASNSPKHILQDVQTAIHTLISEPVNTKADWKQTTSPTASRSRA